MKKAQEGHLYSMVLKLACVCVRGPDSEAGSESWHRHWPSDRHATVTATDSESPVDRDPGLPVAQQTWTAVAPSLAVVLLRRPS